MAVRVIIFILFVTPVFANFSFFFSVGPEFEEAITQDIWSPAYEVGGLYTDSSGSLGLNLRYRKTHIENTGISDSKNVGLTITDIAAVYGYPVVFYTFGAHPFIGMGARLKNRAGYFVDLGPAGQEKIKATTKAFLLLFAGMNLSKNITEKVDVFLKPEIIMHNLKKVTYSFALTGGFSVSI